MSSPKGKRVAQATESVKETIFLAHISPELARSNFHALLLTNPNFFGNLAESSFKPILKIAGDTAYESIGCVGYNPQLEQLRATININQSGGYSGDICSSGSQEFVRFYLSFDNGATWQDQGIRSVNVFDVPGPKPLEYAVTLPISPKEDFCFFQNLPLVRAILSWNFPPPAASPDWTPVWGNVVDAQIQVEGFKFIPLNLFLQEAKLELPAEIAQSVDLGQPVQTVTPKELSPVELHHLYAEKKVPQHRYLAPSLAASAGVPAFAAQAKAALQHTAHAKAHASIAGITNINLVSLIEKWLNTSGDTAFEQLDCLGLDPSSSQLAGILKVKQSSGYSGGPCTTGSKEFVAFWVDWGYGWEYTGTTSVVVHDFTGIPANGLDYNVFLPVDLLSHAQPCWDGPRTANVRAVLSWNTPPSTSDPYAPVVWGNSIEGLILIPPGQIIGNGQQVPFLARVGDIESLLIGNDGRITNASTLVTGAHFVDAPFGGSINLSGQISNPVANLKYRIMKAPHGTSAFVPLIHEPQGFGLTIDTFSGGVWTQTNLTSHADPDGYYTYYDLGANQTVEGHYLGTFYTGPADTGYAYDLRIDLSVDGNPLHDTPSNVVAVLVNNQAPEAHLNPVFGECGKVAPGDVITGVFTATATDFGSYGFTILPPGPAHGHLPAPASDSSTLLGGSVPDPGVTNLAFTLDTGSTLLYPVPMDPCGYSLTLGVWDRTNVNSGQTSNYNQDSIGFCLQIDNS